MGQKMAGGYGKATCCRRTDARWGSVLVFDWSKSLFCVQGGDNLDGGTFSLSVSFSHTLSHSHTQHSHTLRMCEQESERIDSEKGSGSKGKQAHHQRACQFMLCIPPPSPLQMPLSLQFPLPHRPSTGVSPWTFLHLTCLPYRNVPYRTCSVCYHPSISLAFCIVLSVSVSFREASLAPGVYP